MGKRKHSDEDEYIHLARKVVKLNQRLMRARKKQRRRTPSTSSDTGSSSSSSKSRSASPRPRSCTLPSPMLQDALCIEDAPDYTNEGTAPLPSTSAAGETVLPTSAAGETVLPTSAAGETVLPTSADRERAPSTRADGEPMPSTSATARAEATDRVSTDIQLTMSTADGPSVTQIDEDILKILGDDPSQKRIYGKDIQPDLAIRLQHLTTSGLDKEARKGLLDKYLPPANCPLIVAPALNPEVKAAIPENIYRRDQAIEQRQRQRSCIVSCLAETVTTLMVEPRNTVLIQSLMDASKLLCDAQYQDSLNRRQFVLNNIKRELKDQLQSTKIDKFLFSEELSNALKTAKAISKSCADMKLINRKKPAKKY